MAPVAVLMLIGASAASTGGCELLSTVDRSQIPDGVGGHGGHSGTTTTSGTSTASGTGGAGGQGSATTGTTGTGGAGGAGGGSTTTGTGGAGGTGGTGGGTTGTGGGCMDASTCPGVDSECETRTCKAGVCGVDFTAKDTPLAAQVVGDCKTAVCDGVGATTTIDASDPFDDGNPCTDDLCTAGAPTNVPTASGTACMNATGGKLCDGNSACVECVVGADCVSLICQASKCVAESCLDVVKNGKETDVDCGGTDCNKCGTGKGCGAATDCSSGVCTAGLCAAPLCNDTIKNGTESDIDCGGGTCIACQAGKTCTVNGDCVGGACSGSTCLATCTDGVKNAAETDIDCGGPTCTKCVTGKVCGAGTDCASGVCTGGVCKAPTCSDAVKNGTETDVDCGGPSCVPCAPTKVCLVAGDCTSHVCTGGVCQAPTCSDAFKNGTETDVDCGGGTCSACAVGKVCGVGADCVTSVCQGNVCKAAVCGDGITNGAETCDDGNLFNNDGCSTTCTIQVGYTCTGSPSVCVTTCGDGKKAGLETCDDGNTVGGDGCSSTCTVQAGYTCTGTVPSVCTPICGDGIKTGAEACDDGNTTAGDGCSATCTVQSGYTCAGSPSVCTPICGDGIKTGAEACDDGNTVNNDGCSSTCTVQSGYTCTGAPSVCTTTCGDGIQAGAEACDDHNTLNNDGCSSTCTVQTGFACVGTAPSTCTAICGDGLKLGAEQCDDGNTTAGDGCSATCTVQAGYTCTGAPSVCTTICGDGIKTGAEACDDGNTATNDGCSATCTTETGFTCNAASPTVCSAICGDGLKVGTEACDDSNTVSGDGCNATCGVEAGYNCVGQPSVCSAGCGNGVTSGAEQCDDGNLAGGDGCSAACTIELGYTCLGSPSACITTCGDGLKAAIEACDDGNTVNTDGCSATCTVQSGYTCTGSPSVCSTTCGDGIKAGAEGCDDGNTVNTDGCSSTCAVQLGYTCVGAPSVCKTTCGDGLIAGAELCDDGNVASGDGCSTVCATEAGFTCAGMPSVCAAKCGDGLRLGAEQCDDGNIANGDCCSSTCQLEAPNCEREPNNNKAQADANGPSTSGFLYKGAVTPIGDKDYYAFTLTGVSDILLETFDPTGPYTCSIDTKIELIAPDGTTQLALDDDSGPSSCSLIDPNPYHTTSPNFTGGIIPVPAAQHLAPGTYYAIVRHYSGTTGTAIIAGYTFRGTILSTCGNGIVESTEQCDDSNAVNGDGCTSICHLEATSETEPNNTCATANGPITLGGAGSSKLINGGITVANEQDWFSFTTTAITDLKVETFDSTGPGSCTAIDTKIQLFKSDCVTAQSAIQDQGGLGNCSKLDPALLTTVQHLLPGTYVVNVFPASATATFNYSLNATVVASCGNGIKEGSEQCDGGALCQADCLLIPVCGDGVRSLGETCDDGNTTSGDGCSATCTLQAGFTCTTASPNVCTTICGDGLKLGAEACDDGNTTAGDGCSATCTVQTGFTCNAASPNVCTAICGDGLKLGAEKCDDGNTTAGDGCSATCQFETLIPEVEANNTCATANGAYPIPALGTYTMLSGAIGVAADQDWFRFTVPNYADVKFETFDANGPSTCASIDTEIQLFKADCVTTQTALQDDGGVGYCSRIDPSVLPTAQHLAPGNYNLKVFALSSTATFNYTLQVTTTALCGNGVKQGSEQCDDGNAVNNDGCQNDCTITPLCGDNLKSLGEQCDDGNTASGDGCGPTCQFETLIPEVEANSTCATANGAYTIPALGTYTMLSGAIGVAADQDWFRFTVPSYADVKFETFDGTGPSACASIDTQIQLFKADCVTTQTAVQDNGGVGLCSKIDPAVLTTVRHLAPGNYNLKVLALSATATFNYSLQVTTTALCGNGVTQGSEQCDGGALCAADCTLIPACGDGFRSLGEACDDGNTVAGDGCSATCQWETTAEVEPNGTTAQADTALPVITGNINLTGAITPAAEKDIFKVVVAATSVVRFEAFDPSGSDCTAALIPAAMKMTLLDSAGVTLKTDTATSGIGLCPELSVLLSVGTYYIQLEKSTTAGTVAGYFLQVRFQTDDGSEVEPNDTLATASTMPGREMQMLGDHAVSTDLDWYKLTIPVLMSIRAETIEGDVPTGAAPYNETCESNGIDSTLYLLNAAGTLLGSDGDTGRGYCSQIDGTGVTPVNAFARNLAAGTYYLRVESYSTTATADNQFKYHLSVVAR